MKEKFLNIIKSKYTWIVFLFLESLLILLVKPIYRDDLIFSSSLDNGKKLFDVIAYRYSTWSSRSIIEIVLILVASTHKIVWQILQIFMIWLLAFSISKLFLNKDNNNENIALFSLLLAYPMFNFCTAGWEATTINYFWPLSLGLYSFISIKEMFENKKNSVFKYILYSISIIFACNMEQMGIIILLVYTIYLVIYYLQNKKIHLFFIVQIAISILSLIFIFTCKGNYIRQQAEITNYIDYPQLSFLDKIGMCFTTTMNDYLNWYAYPVSILCVTLPIFILLNYKEKIFRLISLIPLIIFFPLKYFDVLFIKIFPEIEKIKGILMARSVVINCENGNNIFSWLALLMSILFFACIAISLILLYDNIKKNNAIIIFLIGAISKFILVFTSSIFASAPRTIIYFDFSILIVVFLIMQEILKKNERFFSNTLLGIQSLAIYQFINNIILIINGLP